LVHGQCDAIITVTYLSQSMAIFWQLQNQFVNQLARVPNQTSFYISTWNKFSESVLFLMFMHYYYETNTLYPFLVRRVIESISFAYSGFYAVQFCLILHVGIGKFRIVFLLSFNPPPK